MPKRRPENTDQSAAGYVRVSLEEQARHGISLGVQEKEVTDYCALRKIQLVRVLKDAGVSGWKHLGRRPYGRSLVALVRDGAIKHVVITRLDRLFRNAQDCLTVVNAWDKLNVTLHIINLGGNTFDTRSPMGRFFLSVMAAYAEMERNTIRERALEIVRHKRSRREWLGATPYGFTRTSDNHVKEDSFQQSVIQWISRSLRGGLSFREITERLNAKGTPAPKGKHWHVTTVKRIASTAERRVVKEP